MLLTQKLWLTGEQPGHWQQDEFKGFCTQIYRPLCFRCITILRKITLCVCPQRVSNGFELVDMFKFSSQLLWSKYPEITTIFQRRQPRKKLYGTKISNVTSLGFLYMDLTKGTQKKDALQPQNNQVATAQAFKWRGSTTTQFSKIVLNFRKLSVSELFRNAHIFHYMLPAIYLAGWILKRSGH